MKNYNRPLIEVFSSRPDKYKLTLEGLKKAGLKSGNSLLEIGCAYGDTSIFIADNFDCSVTGIDLDKTYILKAKQKYKDTKNKVFYKVDNAENLSFNHLTYDCIFSEAAFSLLYHKEKAVKEFNRVLVSKGKVIINDFIIKKNISDGIQKEMSFIPCFGGVRTVEEYLKLFKENNFKCLYFKDHSKEIIKTAMWISKEYGCSPKNLDELFVNFLGKGSGDIDICRSFFKSAGLGYIQLIFQKV